MCWPAGNVGNSPFAGTLFAGGLDDVGVTSIIAPTDTVDSGTVVTPRAWIRNFGNTVCTFPTTMLIGTSYAGTQTVTDLAPGDSTSIESPGAARPSLPGTRTPAMTRCPARSRYG